MRKLGYRVMDKPVRQMSAADGKAVNARMDKAISKRSAAHKPKTDHPWKKSLLAKPIPNPPKAVANSGKLPSL